MANTNDSNDKVLEGLNKLLERLDKDAEQFTALKATVDAIGKRMDAVEGLGQRLDSVEGRMGAARDDAAEDERREERQAFCDAQVKADRVAHAFGDSAGAPHWMHGETVAEYIRRLAGPYKRYSKHWKDIDLNRLDASAVGIAADQIYADAYEASTSPETVGAGALREVVTVDDAGRKI